MPFEKGRSTSSASSRLGLMQMADLIAYWIFRHYQSGDQRGYNLIKPYFARYGAAPVSGLCCHVTPETEVRLASLPTPTHPFPNTTPKLATVETAETIPPES